MKHDEILRTNRQVYDAMAGRGDPLARPASDDELANPLATVDGAGWLGESISGRRLLCLAGGGGRQSSLYAAAGAEVTVVDISGAMLELDRRTAEQRGFSIRLFESSMDDLSMLRDGEFDIVIHPVSTCYLPDVQNVFHDIARVTRAGGIYISQHKQPVSLQASCQRNSDGHFAIEQTYDRKEPVPAPTTANSTSRRLREAGAIEFLHPWETLIGGICRAGFVVDDLLEPMHARDDAPRGTFADRARYVPPYVRIKAIRRGSPGAANLWLSS